MSEGRSDDAPERRSRADVYSSARIGAAATFTLVLVVLPPGATPTVYDRSQQLPRNPRVGLPADLFTATVRRILVRPPYPGLGVALALALAPVAAAGRPHLAPPPRQSPSAADETIAGSATGLEKRAEGRP